MFSEEAECRYTAYRIIKQDASGFIITKRGLIHETDFMSCVRLRVREAYKPFHLIMIALTGARRTCPVDAADIVSAG